tara:strand:+ start:667 stop:804 length:138 start_codon:yes stop_codon:yes gene_type:complete
MSEDKKRLQEINVTLERCVEHMVELYHEKEELKKRIDDESSDVSV